MVQDADTQIPGEFDTDLGESGENPDARVSRAPAVDRALAILNLLAAETMPLGVTEVAKRLDLNPSTCLHVLRALETSSLVQQARGSKKYILGPGIVVLARRALSKDSFLRDIQRPLDELAERFHCTALVLQPDNEDHLVVTAIAKVEGLLSIHIEVGRRVPAMVAASGRCVAAHSRESKAELRRRFDKLKWSSPPDFETWYAQVEQTRQTGVGMDIGNFVAGFSMFSTAILKGGSIWRIISMVKAGSEFSEREVAEMSSSLLEIAAEASHHD